jgi:hypothetical protein
LRRSWRLLRSGWRRRLLACYQGPLLQGYSSKVVVSMQ